MAVYSDLPIVGREPEVVMARFVRQVRVARVASLHQLGGARSVRYSHSVRVKNSGRL